MRLQETSELEEGSKGPAGEEKRLELGVCSGAEGDRSEMTLTCWPQSRAGCRAPGRKMQEGA